MRGPGSRAEKSAGGVQSAGFKDIEKDLRERRFVPVYLLYGEETLMRDEVASALVDAILDGEMDPSTRDFNLTTFDAAETPADTITGAIVSLPIFAPKRVIVVKNLDALKVEAEARIADAIFQMPGTNVVILVAEKNDGRRRIFNVVTRVGRAVEFKRLYPRDAQDWVIKKAGRMGLTLDARAALYLVSAVGVDLRRLETELEKIRTYLGDVEGARVSENDIAELVGKSLEEDIFALLDAVGNRNLDAALDCLNSITRRGEPAIRVITMVAWQLRGILQARLLRDAKMPMNKIISELGRAPFAVRKCLAQAERFSPADLRTALTLCHGADLEVKTGTLSERLVLERLILNLCRTGRRSPGRKPGRLAGCNRTE
ncbi:MAG: DNA polymerase III subunit delta [Firmicutes bacterium]|nr:DNA polymerase III subunit delta [Bacillota bacterium]